MSWLKEFYDIHLGSSDKLTDYLVLKLIGRVDFNALTIADPPIDVTNLSVSYPEPPENGELMEVLSTNVTDDEMIEIVGLDENGYFKNDIATLNGTTPVTVGLWSWVYRIRNISPTSSVGQVDIRSVNNPSNVYARIDIIPIARKPEQSFNGVLKVPLNCKKAFAFETLTQLTKTGGNKLNIVQCDLMFKTKNPLTGQYTRFITYLPTQLVADGASIVELKPSIPVELLPGDILKWQINFANEANNEVTAIFDVLFIFTPS